MEFGGVGGRLVQQKKDLSKFTMLYILSDIVCEVIVSNLLVLNRV